jgi:hypothetical protein
MPARGVLPENQAPQLLSLQVPNVDVAVKARADKAREHGDVVQVVYAVAMSPPLKHQLNIPRSKVLILCCR